MNLLSSTKDDQLEKKILTTLNQLDLTDDEKNVAKEFFDFSKEIDISLLDNLHYRKVNYNVGHRNSCFLYDDLLRLPYKKSHDATDRYILFLDAIGENTIGRLLLYGNYCYHYNDSYLERVSHAYKLKYSTEDVLAKTAAFVSYGINIEKVLYNNTLIQKAMYDPRIMYRAGKYFCHGNEGNAKARVYSLALAYCKEDDFTADELDEMQSYILQRNKELSVQYSAELENMVIMLFMSMKSSTKIRSQLENRLKPKYDKILPAFLQFIPSDYFEKNMEILTEIADNSDNMTTEKLIKLAVKSCAASNAFKVPLQSNYYPANSMHFLELLAKNYTEEYITTMTANEPVGVGARWGYYFDYYGELSEVLKRVVPDVKEKYALNSQKEMVEMIIHREALDVKNTIRREVMDYLRGDTDISILESIRTELAENHKHWNGSMQHEEKMLGQLIACGDFYGRYVALKMIQNIECIKQYIISLIHLNQDIGAATKQIFSAAIRENVPIDDRIRIFELLYSYLYYWEDRKKAINDAIVEVMTENSEKCDSDYERECMKHQIYTCCCYVNYLGRTNINNKNKYRLLALCGHTSKEVRRTVVEILAKYPEYEPDITALLSAKKQALREMAVDIFAMWGQEKYCEILKKAADSEKSIKLADKIRALLSTSVSASVDKNGNTVFSPIAFVEDIHKGGRARKITWLFDGSLPEVHFRNGTPADEKYMQALILCYSTMPVPGRNDNAFLLAAELNEKELNCFAAEIFSHWYSAGAEAKTKWAMYFAIIHGGDKMVEYALKCVKEWAENMRGAIAADAVKAISLNGSSQALMIVDNLAHKFKQKQVKKAAIEALDTAAEALGITADELGDRIVPDLGFNERMEQIFDYGTRKFKVYLTPTLDLEIYDENDKKLKTMPSPGKRDDEELAKKSNTEFKQMKKQLKNVISIQKMRLETALLADRRWKKAAWENLFVRNPVMHSFAIGLIWAAYMDDGQVQTFRYMEDGSFNTSDEDEYELPENAKIGLVHPIDLDEDTLSAWKEQLSDYEIIQPIEQLERKIYRITDEEKGQLDLNRFKGREINGMTLLGRTSKLGWYKGSPQDAGCFYEFYREDITERIKNADGTVTLKGNAAELHFEGMYIAGDDSEVTIENVRFYDPGNIQRGSYVYDRADDSKAIMLDEISPRYLSEIIMQLEEVTKRTEQ